MSARAAPAGLKVYLGLYLVFLYGPLILIPLFSFNDSAQAAFPMKGLTLDWYRALAGNERLGAATLNSLMVALCASILATAAGTTIAYAATRRRGRWAPMFSALARLPILVPGVILGIGTLILVNLVGLGPSLTAVTLGHVAFTLPITVTLIGARLAQVPRTLEEAALDLGAREWTVLRRIVLPIAAPAILSAFMLAFVTSFDEFIVAFFLTGTDATLPVYIWSQLRFPKELPSVMALGSLVLAASVVLVLAADRIGRLGPRAARAPAMPRIPKPSEGA